MIKILEVNSVDLIGNRWNGYDMIEELKKDFDVRQAVVQKLSDNPKVVELVSGESKKVIHDKFMHYEEPLESVKCVLSISSPLLMRTKEYKEADIIHIHLLHNSGMSLYSLRKIAQEKKVIITIHDPWIATGKCVYPYACEKWKNGCHTCDNLSSFFPMREDNCHDMWNLKKKVLEDLDIDVIAASDWTEDIIKESPILNKLKNVHKIYFGMNTEKFNKVSYKEARKKLNISDDEVVLFHRAQNEFKGTPYVLEALKNLKTEKKVTILTCEGVGLLDEVKDKFNVRDLGVIKDKEMIVAMNACDIFLMPSLSESFGLMAIEAMSCAKPVVVFDNSALPSVTRAPKCGYLVKDRDSADLEKAIKELIENPKERMRRGKLGKKIVEKDYQEKKYYDSLRKLYKKVYNKKRKPKKEEKIKETENARQYKFYLNDLTVILFGEFSKISK